MIKVKYLILGGGPSGLTLANALIQKGEDSVLLIEKESEAGGLCRSADIDGWALDTGGGHFLDVRRPEVCDFLFRFGSYRGTARCLPLADERPHIL